MLILEIFDIKFHRYGAIENVSYATYTKDYIDVGSFSINCLTSEKNIENIRTDRIVWLEGNVAGIIQHIILENDNIKIEGKLLNCILEWRYIYPQISTFKMPRNKIIEKIVKENCLASTDKKRNFDFLKIEESNFEFDKISKEITGDAVQDAILEIFDSESFNGLVRVDVGFYPKEKCFKFHISKGYDLTRGNDEGNKTVSFTQDLKNIISSKFEQSNVNFKNVSLVAGEIVEGKKRVFVKINDTNSGYNRRELFVDARDLQSEYIDDDGNEKTLSQSDYIELLLSRGNEKLSEFKENESYEASIENNKSMFKYGIDYNLGDMVDVVDNKLKIKIKSIVTSVTVTQDKNGYSLDTTFGYGLPTIFKKMRRRKII